MVESAVPPARTARAVRSHDHRYHAVSGARTLLESSMERLTRIRVAIAAVVCCALAAITWTVAIYAYNNTPEIHNVVIKAANDDQLIESKAKYLFVPAAFPIFFCLMILNPLIRWRTVVRKAVARAAPKDLWTEPTIGRFRFATVWNGVNIGVCVLSGLTLYEVVERAEYLLGK